MTTLTPDQRLNRIWAHVCELSDLPTDQDSKKGELLIEIKRQVEELRKLGYYVE